MVSFSLLTKILLGVLSVGAIGGGTSIGVVSFMGNKNESTEITQSKQKVEEEEKLDDDTDLQIVSRGRVTCFYKIGKKDRKLKGYNCNWNRF
ncbi:hydroxymethylglutaryl-CoA reductase [Mycoplasma suis]|uniref:Uncharacterized protein n=2 Tax=Mycoplasma suis TaxID=57372 RepID=F0QS27_MYCSL|nr:hydroxymethylglutaryl-CoA reductase [Mycoplasma suis]ADX98297.1 hypothetical protein MSU_0772 [Mycoplasma suis str. Illinois]CBZ40811.1 Hydroxymethylglutaryl-CoA reductase, class I/II [Mycoplasma suis KI3806]